MEKTIHQILINSSKSSERDNMNLLLQKDRMLLDKKTYTILLLLLAPVPRHHRTLNARPFKPTKRYFVTQRKTFKQRKTN